MTGSRPIPLRLETDDLQIAVDLLSGDTALQPGVALTAPGGAKVRFRSRVRKGPSAPRGRREFDLLDAAPTSVEPLASWLYQSLRSRLPKVWIGRAAVEVETTALEKALHQAIGGR